MVASLLRQIVAGPRLRNAEANLDLCYVTDNIIATSGPSSTYPQRAYRNPTDELVKFLDSKHGEDWAIWEFRAEGTGYPDSEVYGRIRHYPWPDHHPPPFALVPLIMASMRNWLKDPSAQRDKRVVVVHCKAGKGRSGTVACSYLISEEGWGMKDALARFTARRMRSGFGEGVSIPSQLRWVGYTDKWAKGGNVYVERQIEILEVHVWGLRDGVKVAIDGYVDEGRNIKTFHIFNKSERLVIGDTVESDKGVDSLGIPESASDAQTSWNSTKTKTEAKTHSDLSSPLESPQGFRHTGSELGGAAVAFRPSSRIVLPSSDICIDFERRNRAPYGWTMVTAVAHVWFNAFFEGQEASLNNDAPPNGVFKIDWDAMDGIKGSSRKGTRALDRLAVVWRALDAEGEGKGLTQIITEPPLGAPVPESGAADWQHGSATSPSSGKGLGLRVESPSGGNMSRASSVRSARSSTDVRSDDDHDSLEGVKAHGLNGQHLDHDRTESGDPDLSHHVTADSEDFSSSGGLSKVGPGKASGIVGGMKHVGTGDLPGGRPEGEMETSVESKLGSVSKGSFAPG